MVGTAGGALWVHTTPIVRSAKYDERKSLLSHSLQQQANRQAGHQHHSQHALSQ